MERKEYAVSLKKNGYNCCQAVLAAFAEETGLPDETLRRIGAAYGGGMGNMNGPCGALCGAQMARKLQTGFVEKTGGQICREIKGIDTGKMLCPCEDCIRNAVTVLEASLEAEA